MESISAIDSAIPVVTALRSDAGLWRRRGSFLFGVRIQLVLDIGRISDQCITQFLHLVGALVLLIGACTLSFGKHRTVRRLFDEGIEGFLKTCFFCTHTVAQ